MNLTDELDRFVLTKVESGRHENASEVVRAALRTLEREEQQYELKLAGLRAAIDEGDASGIAEGDPFARVREALHLPASLTGGGVSLIPPCRGRFAEHRRLYIEYVGRGIHGPRLRPPVRLISWRIAASTSQTVRLQGAPAETPRPAAARKLMSSASQQAKAPEGDSDEGSSGRLRGRRRALKTKTAERARCP